MKKILELTGEPIGSGGQEMFIINVLRNIDLEGLQIDWCTPYYCENSIYGDEIKGRGGTVFSLGLAFNPGGSRLNIFPPLLRFLKKNKYEVVHIHSGSISVLTICSVIAYLCGVKTIIVHSHCTGIKKTMGYYLLKFISSAFLRIFPTHYCACSIEAGEWKFPKSIVHNKLLVLNNGIDLRKFSPNIQIGKKIRKALKIDEDCLLIGHVGRFSFQKNQEYLVDILYHMKSKGIQSKLILIGEGELLAENKALVQKLDLRDDVIYIGVVPNVYDYMQAMNVFVFPSRWEGLGMVAVEAQAVGLPVIASTNVPRAADLTETMIFLDLEDKESWINAILSCRYKRFNNISQIQKNGYDIKDAADCVRKLYLN